MTRRNRTCSDREPLLLLHTAALAAFLIVANPAMPLMAQGLDNEDAIETIIDAPVATEEKPVSEMESRLTDAIRASSSNAREVRKRFSIEKFDIVFVPELAEEGTPLGKLIADHDEAIQELRVAIEGSALFYHAVDSHSVLLRDIVAIEFGDGNDVTVFAAGKDPES